MTTPSLGPIPVALLLLAGLLAQPCLAQGRGEQLFKQTCVACHTIGGGRLVGPDLAGVTEQRPEDWLIRFVKSSQQVIRSGDSVATALFEEYGRMVMPDHPYSDDEVHLILQYIREQSGAGGAVVAAPPDTGVVVEDPEQAIRLGRALFAGRLRLENGGAACNSCHTVEGAGITTGGALAKDLTTAYTRLSEAGLKSIIASSPFPAMQQALGAGPTPEETAYLTAFLRAADAQATAQATAQAAGEGGTNYALLLLLAGLGGFVALLLLSTAAWSGRARRPVNHAIYARQTKSA